MPKVFIGIGSNINPEQNVTHAVELLGQAVHVVAVSNFYLTEAVGASDQPPFYNGVIEIETEMPADELKYSVLANMEERLGRVRTEDKYAPRTIDLDIILYDDLPQSEDPEIIRRAFLAIPLCELSPDLVLPRSGRSIKDIADSLANTHMTPLPDFTGQLRRDTEK